MKCLVARLLTCVPRACELQPLCLFDVDVMLVNDLIGSLSWWAYTLYPSSVSLPFTFCPFSFALLALSMF